MKTEPRSHCPISLALEVIGDKWSLLILRDLIVRGKQRYQEFLGAAEKISTNILADRLARLEALGILTKSPDPASKKQFLYAPTQKGLDLLPILFELARWGIKHDPETDMTSPNVKRLQKDAEGWRRELLARFEPCSRVAAG